MSLSTRCKIILTALIVLALSPCVGCKRATMTAPSSPAETVDPWKAAVTRVEQDREEAVGRKATVEVPEQLKHYANRRRFLAVQEADSRVVEISRDFADLARLIEREELVEMKPLGADYILYGVGQSVSGAPFEHYDTATRREVPLASTEEIFREEVRRASDSVKDSAARLAQVEAELRRTPKRDRARRATLLNEVAKARRAVAASKAQNKLLSSFYADPRRRKSVLAEYQLLSDIARDFGGEAYDLNDSDARRRFKIRLLSFIRPEALDLLLQIAHGYKEKFDRVLPVSSLVRPVQYQHELAETNANAARGSMPPHSTGLAFDLYYRYMSAAEQEYLMSVIAQLEDEGRVEALREARDNIHVYVFENGRRPDEKLVARVIASERSPRPGKKSRVASQPGRKRRAASKR